MQFTQATVDYVSNIIVSTFAGLAGVGSLVDGTGGTVSLFVSKSWI